MGEEILSKLRDFFWYQVEERNVIIIDLDGEKTTISFKVERNVLKKLNELARRMGVTKSALLRAIVKKLVESDIDANGRIVFVVNLRDIHSEIL